MHRVDSAGNNLGYFTDGDPLTATPATVLGAKWHNAVQEEIAGIIESAGITLSTASSAQLLAALVAKFGAKATANTWALVQTLTQGAVFGAGGLNYIDGLGDGTLRDVQVRDLYASGNATLPNIAGNSTVAGTLSAGTLALASAVSRYAYADAAEFATDTHGRYSLTASGHYMISDGTAAAVGARVRLPPSTAIASVEILMANFDPSLSQSLSTIQVVRAADGGFGTTTAPTRTQLQFGASGAISLPATTPFAWKNLSLVGGSTTGVDGWLTVNFTLPASVNLAVAAIRVRYSHTSVAPA